MNAIWCHMCWSKLVQSIAWHLFATNHYQNHWWLAAVVFCWGYHHQHHHDEQLSICLIYVLISALLGQIVLLEEILKGLIDYELMSVKNILAQNIFITNWCVDVVLLYIDFSMLIAYHIIGLAGVIFNTSQLLVATTNGYQMSLYQGILSKEPYPPCLRIGPFWQDTLDIWMCMNDTGKTGIHLAQ